MRPKGSPEQLQTRRMIAAKMLQQGLSVSKIARLLEVAPSSVSRWKQAFTQAGKDGLKAKPHPGPKPKLSKQQLQHLTQLLLQGPEAHGYKNALWTLRRVTEVVRRHFGVTYHHCHMWRILRSLGFSCQKPEKRARERDDDEIQRWCREDWPEIKKSEKRPTSYSFHRRERFHAATRGASDVGTVWTDSYPL